MYFLFEDETKVSNRIVHTPPNRNTSPDGTYLIILNDVARSTIATEKISPDDLRALADHLEAQRAKKC
tara:strand:- start:476 stop:679 length:204 start_codon:yes stop_codon:yes gene_type:complete